MTILGHASAAELQALLAAKNFENSRIQAARAASSVATPAALAWDADWKKYLDRYAAAKSAAEITLGLANASGAGLDNYPAQDAWNWVLWAEHEPTLTDRLLGRLSTTPDKDTDKLGLYRRFVPLFGEVDFSGEPQPPKRDLDLAAFVATDAAARKLESAERFGLAWGPWILVAGIIAFLGIRRRP